MPKSCRTFRIILCIKTMPKSEIARDRISLWAVGLRGATPRPKGQRLHAFMGDAWKAMSQAGRPDMLDVDRSPALSLIAALSLASTPRGS